jgi:hypothetical protein
VRALEEKGSQYILPIRVDDTELEGASCERRLHADKDRYREDCRVVDQEASVFLGSPMQVGARATTSLKWVQASLLTTADCADGPHFGAGREEGQNQPVELYEVRFRRFSALDGVKRCGDSLTRERRRDDDYSSHQTGVQEGLLKRLL